jgi:hypothetical protein
MTTILYIAAGERLIRDGIVEYANIGMTKYTAEERVKCSDYARKAAGGRWIILAQFDVTGHSDYAVREVLRKRGFVINPDDTSNIEEAKFYLPKQEVIDIISSCVSELQGRDGLILPEAGLSQSQYNAACNVIRAIEDGKRTIIAELCARFGKTIWGGVLARELNANLTIVASYVLTSLTSFKNDLTRFEQFRDFVIVDADPDVKGWESDIRSALASEKQVIVLLSMCNSSKRQSKLDFLFGLDVNRRLLIVDEADFGVHKANQSKPLVEGRRDDDVVILMTGTNGDKAASIWPVDHYLSVTYPELLIEKNRSKLAS